MKTRLIFLLAILFSLQIVSAQDYLIKMETNVTGMGNDKMKIEYICYMKSNGDTKIDTKGKEFTMVMSNLSEKVKIIKTEKGSKDLCAEGTREEFNEANEKNTPNVEYKDVKIEKLKGTATIAGYECKSAKVSYKTTGFMAGKSENTVWYTDQVTTSNTNLLNTSSNVQENAYTDALKSLGTVFKTETKGFAGIATVMEVTEFKKQDFTASEMDLDMSKCKKVLTIKEYNKEISDREMSRAQFRQNQMMQKH